MSTITVTTASDTINAADGVTSLREAIAAAHSGDLILFQAALKGSTIGIKAANGPLDIASGANLQISGDIDHDGLADVTLDGLAATSILTVESGATASITGIRFQGGTATGPALGSSAAGVGGTLGDAGTAGAAGTPDGAAGGDASPGGDGQTGEAGQDAPVQAGAILNRGTLILRSVEFIDNHASGGAGGGAGGGGYGGFGGTGGAGGNGSTSDGSAAHGGSGGNGGSGGDGGDGGHGGAGGAAAGAVANVGSLTLIDVGFSNNVGTGEGRRRRWWQLRRPRWRWRSGRHGICRQWRLWLWRQWRQRRK